MSREYLSSLEDILQFMIRQFTGVKLSSPRLDAELLMALALGVDRIELYTKPDRILNKEEADRVSMLFSYRLMRFPMAYLLGEKEFFSLPFYVNTHVLVPRPETEYLVEHALRCIEKIKSPYIADIGTGSGVVGICIRSVRSDASVLLLDRSADALHVAKTNADRLQQAVFLLQADGTLPFCRPGLLDLVVSNPPYITDDEMRYLPSEVLKEPRIALQGGPDGLDIIRGIVHNAKQMLRQGGYLAFEVGAKQARQVATLLVEAGFGGIQIHLDGAGIERVIIGRFGAGKDREKP